MGEDDTVVGINVTSYHINIRCFAGDTIHGSTGTVIAHVAWLQGATLASAASNIFRLCRCQKPTER